MKNSSLPKLKGRLIRYSPATRPKDIVLSMENPEAEEVFLRLDAPFTNKANPGIDIVFEGTAVFFTREPFTMTIAVQRQNVEGWPSSPRR